MDVAYVRGSVLLRQGDEIPRGRDNFEGFFPIDNALYSIAFGTHTKTAEPIELPFAMLSELGPRNSVSGSDNPRRGRGHFGVNICPTSLTPLIIASWTGPCSGTQKGQMLRCKRWTSLLSAAKWAVRCNVRAPYSAG